MTTKPTKGIAVDASMRGGVSGAKSGVVEWRGVDIATGKELFRSEQFPSGSISIAELMAIFDGVHLAMSDGYSGPVYSDSKVAIKWALTGKVKSNLPVDEATMPLWQKVWSDQGWAAISEVASFIRANLRQWMTSEWGENVADLGYKVASGNTAYVVTHGRVIGIYNTWKECAEQVVGFAGAKFKGFKFKGEAEDYYSQMTK